MKISKVVAEKENLRNAVLHLVCQINFLFSIQHVALSMTKAMEHMAVSVCTCLIKIKDLPHRIGACSVVGCLLSKTATVGATLETH